jgi:hypothetical protein
MIFVALRYMYAYTYTNNWFHLQGVVSMEEVSYDFNCNDLFGRFTLKVKPVPFNATMPAKRLLSTVYPLYIYLKFLTHDDLTDYNSNLLTYRECFMNSTRQVSHYLQ